MKNLLETLIVFFALTFMFGCNCDNSCKNTTTQSGNVTIEKKDSSRSPSNKDSVSTNSNEKNKINNNSKTDLPVVLVYNFHVTNRCPTCIAIEKATTKTLNTYFSAELKQGRIKRKILNVDDEANNKISEKYQAFGSGLFVTRVYKGKEITADLTGDGFKFAKNKEGRFMEILKNKISEYLK
ncbi:MAG: nitrophenyl compound nitroreductase subunit ArsF family protein [Bacteroidales bacterium]|nr:nitrophenyl compound nitroreductase subunit ArsF family protein [Bacteroidales bacterium]